MYVVCVGECVYVNVCVMHVQRQHRELQAKVRASGGWVECWVSVALTAPTLQQPAEGFVPGLRGPTPHHNAIALHARAQFACVCVSRCALFCALVNARVLLLLTECIRQRAQAQACVHSTWRTWTHKTCKIFPDNNYKSKVRCARKACIHVMV